MTPIEESEETQERISKFREARGDFGSNYIDDTIIRAPMETPESPSVAKQRKNISKATSKVENTTPFTPTPVTPTPVRRSTRNSTGNVQQFTNKMIEAEETAVENGAFLKPTKLTSKKRIDRDYWGVPKVASPDSKSLATGVLRYPGQVHQNSLNLPEQQFHWVEADVPELPAKETNDDLKAMGLDPIPVRDMEKHKAGNKKQPLVKDTAATRKRGAPDAELVAENDGESDSPTMSPAKKVKKDTPTADDAEEAESGLESDEKTADDVDDGEYGKTAKSAKKNAAKTPRNSKITFKTPTKKPTRSLSTPGKSSSKSSGNSSGKTPDKNTPRTPKACIESDFVGVPSGHGTTTNRPKSAKLAEPWQCGNLGCVSGMTWLPRRAENNGQGVGRKAVSHFFGRNKTETKSIPDEVIGFYCRKDYQQKAYQAKSLKDEAEWHKLSCLITLERIEDQLTRIELWRPQATFRIVLMKRAGELINAYNDELRKHNQDAAAAAAALAARTPPNKPQNKTPNKTPKKPDEADKTEKKPDEDFPIALLAHVNDNFLGQNKTYAEIRAILAWTRQQVDAGNTDVAPPTEFLISKPFEGEQVNDTTYNYQQWECLKKGIVFDINNVYIPGQAIAADAGGVAVENGSSGEDADGSDLEMSV